MSKNIIVFSDGTGQEGGERYNTNIYKLFNMIEDRTPRQVAFYDAGLGTNWGQRITGSVGGMGFSRNVRQCYQFIFEHFQAGDRIFLFGFSRGAATVRSLSSFIHYFGMLPKSRPELIKKAYKIYKLSKEEERKAKADELVSKNRTIWTKIRFIGCYDTVAALGLPFKFASALLDGLPGFRHRFHNFTLSESIEKAYQALAIDDERKTFHPILWDPEVLPYQSVKQVWFAGMHTDVGGGYEEQELSDIPLVWLTQQATKHGLFIYRDHKEKVNENANGMMHDSRGTFITSLYRREPRSWDITMRGKPIVHQSVLERQKQLATYRPWILGLACDVEPWVRYEKQKWRVKENRRIDRKKSKKTR